jgi:hypothetical protein
MITKITSHVEEYIARYAVLLLTILVPIAAFLGQLAADLGGADTPAGRAVLGAASAVGVAIAGVTYLMNLGKYQIKRDFDSAVEGVDKLISAAKTISDIEATVKPDVPDKEPHEFSAFSRRVEPGQEFPTQPPSQA